MFKSYWGTDWQPDNELNACGRENVNEKGEIKVEIKCFDLKERDNGEVIMTYNNRNYSTNEFCIRINHEAEDLSDHYAEICEKASTPFHP